ncbi:MAG: hypothetical protein FWE90_04655 [Defluviitaleaceae bacterium]|nr:hypothetical protein [Defluviitaleaceae bacterium]
MTRDAVNERELRADAEQGDALAMLQWGNYLMSQKKTDEAVTWWEKAAEAGRAGGAYNLARYYSGLDTGKGDALKLQEWLNRLAYAHNDGWGMIQLGIILCGGTHQIWKKTIPHDAFTVQRNIEEGLRLITQGVKRAEATTKDLTLYDYDAAAEVVRAYSGPLGIEVLKLALAYKTKARGLIPPGYTAMSDAASNVISQLQREIAHQPATVLPTRVEVIPRTASGEPPRAPTRVMAAPMPAPRARTVPRHVPPPNDIKRRDPRAGFGLGLQIVLAIVFMIVMGCILTMGFFDFERETFEDAVRLRVTLYGILAVAAIVIGAVSIAYRWGALGSGKGISTLVALGGVYAATVNVFDELVGEVLSRAVWELAFSAVGVAVTTSVIAGILMWIVTKIYDNAMITRMGKLTLYVLMAALFGGGMLYLLWHVVPESIFAEVLISPFRSAPFVWLALLPGTLLMRWAEDV